MEENNAYGLAILRVENGYVVSWKEERETGWKVKKMVFEERDKLKWSELSSEEYVMRDLLYFVKEFFGVYYNKHKVCNLIIREEKSDEVDL